MKTHEKVFNILWQAPDYVSAKKLSEKLKLPCTSIYTAIQKLKRSCITIDSVKNKGYKIRSGDLLIKEKIETHCPVKVTIRPNSRSTQLDAKRGIEKGSVGNILYLSPNQKDARGRFGRSFFSSPKQGGIYMSLHLKPNVHATNLPAYTLLTAAAIYKAIYNLTLIKTQIKWVNDIYLEGKKIAGIITEAFTSSETNLVTDIIIGIGLNFTIHDFPDNLADTATSLFSDIAPITRNELIAEIWKIFYESSSRELINLYKGNSMVVGKDIVFEENGNILYARAIDISDRGLLLVRLANGQEKLLSSGEIRLLSW